LTSAAEECEIGSLAVMSSHLIPSLVASADGGGSAALLQLGILLLIPFAMYFFLIRPQRRRMREQQELQRSIQVGDEVITTSGIYGTITGEDGENRFWLEIDDDVQIRIARAAVQGRASAEEPDDDDAELESASSADDDDD
jgi:preprotein translocase subunit YajC